MNNKPTEKQKIKLKRVENRTENGHFDVGVVGTITRFVLSHLKCS